MSTFGHSGEDEFVVENIQDQMTPILRQIATALIETTPEEWSKATLRSEASRSGGQTELAHSIWSDLHPAEVAVGTEDLFLAVRELQLVCDGAGHPWSALVVQIEQEEGQWRFTANFEYPVEGG